MCFFECAHEHTVSCVDETENDENLDDTSDDCASDCKLS